MGALEVSGVIYMYFQLNQVYIDTPGIVPGILRVDKLFLRINKLFLRILIMLYCNNAK